MSNGTLAQPRLGKHPDMSGSAKALVDHALHDLNRELHVFRVGGVRVAFLLFGIRQIIVRDLGLRLLLSKGANSCISAAVSHQS